MPLILFGLDRETKQIVRELIELWKRKTANDELAEAAREALPDIKQVADDLNMFTPES